MTSYLVTIEHVGSNIRISKIFRAASEALALRAAYRALPSDYDVISIATPRRRFFKISHNGKIVFWRIGRIGGSFYLANRQAAA